MRKILVLAVGIVLLSAGFAQAANTLDIGGTFSHDIYMTGPTGTNPYGGGSAETSYLNGIQLKYLYCVDIGTNVYVPDSYPQTLVNTDGKIYGNANPITNVNQVAWLLTQYGTSGQGDQARALQAVIWYEVTGGAYTLANNANNASFYGTYLTYRDAVSGATMVPNLVHNFYWITPGKNDVQYQGLVAPVPIPSAAWLLGSGLLGLIGLKRRRGKEV